MSSRRNEIAKYEAAYKDDKYGLGKRRREHIQSHLGRLEKGSLLDVSTGRGEVLDIARKMGFSPVVGTEAVDYLCDDETVVSAYAHELPFADSSFDVVSMFDVMEHLIPSDTEAVCKELKRVAAKRVLLTVHNGPHRFKGMDLHINRRNSYAAWHQELEDCFGCPVVNHGLQGSISCMFEVVL